MSDNPVFDAYSRYYDLLYQDKDYDGEVKYIDSLLRKYKVPGNDWKSGIQKKTRQRVIDALSEL